MLTTKFFPTLLIILDVLAAEKTGRICYGMELSEHYCDVIIKRWEDFTGRKAELLK